MPTQAELNVLFDAFEIASAFEKAREYFAGICRRPISEWTYVPKPEPGVWYDWANPALREHGQCRMNADGTWAQAPGPGAVLLAWRSR